MREVFTNLWVGNQDDYENNVKLKSGWAIIQACKEPYHRKALGYTGRGAPKDSPEYLFAIRDNRLILNMVDTSSADYIPKEIVDKALEYIENCMTNGLKVLVHCNQGGSRAPSLALLYLAAHAFFKGDTFYECEAEFVSLYPDYSPASGIRDFCIRNWKEYHINF